MLIINQMHDNSRMGPHAMGVRWSPFGDVCVVQATPRIRGYALALGVI